MFTNPVGASPVTLTCCVCGLLAAPDVQSAPSEGAFRFAGVLVSAGTRLVVALPDGWSYAAGGCACSRSCREVLDARARRTRSPQDGEPR